MNFDRKSKWLGIIDYKSLIVIIIYAFIVGYFLSLFNLSIEKLIYIFLFFTTPVIAMLCVNTNNENVLDMVMILLKFQSNNKIYVKKEDIKKISKEIYINYNNKIYKK